MRDGASVPCSTRFERNFSKERKFLLFPGWMEGFFQGCVFKSFFLAFNFNFHQSNLFCIKQSFYLFRNIDVSVIYKVRIFINIRSAIKLIAAVSFAWRATSVFDRSTRLSRYTRQ